MITVTIRQRSKALPDGPVIRQDGGIVVLCGHDDDGKAITCGVDYRVARDLLDLLAEEESIPCAVESWQILSAVIPC